MSFPDEIEAALPALRRYARALLRDRDAADDLVQDCLERALSRRHLWRGEGPVRAWLYQILLNLFRDGRRRRVTLVPLDAAPEEGRPAPQDGQLALNEVHRAMGALPEEQRAALLLVAVEGFSLAEAARLLGIAEGTLASRLARARAQLRQLTGHGPADRKEAQR